MSGAVITVFILLHTAMWFIQIMVNKAGGAADCEEISAFACGSPVLGRVAEFVANQGDVKGLWDVFNFLKDSVGLILTIFIGLAFFNYPWLDGGGQVVEVGVIVLKGVMGGVLIGTLLKMAVSVVGGKLG